jgi:hypothetical protein
MTEKRKIIFNETTLEEITEKGAIEKGLRHISDIKGTNITHCMFILERKYKGKDKIKYYSVDFNNKGCKMDFYSD